MVDNGLTRPLRNQVHSILRSKNFFEREIKMTFQGARSMCPKFREIISQRNRKIQIFK